MTRPTLAHAASGRISMKEVVDQLVIQRAQAGWATAKRKGSGSQFVRVIYTPTGGQPGWHRPH